MVKYSVILPTYNERENLPLMVSMINKVFAQMYVKCGFRFSDIMVFMRGCVCRKEEFEIVVVDDNSPDGTLEIAQQLQKMKWDAGKIVIKSRPGKLGLGTAYMDGLKACSGEFVFLMDADMSHHPRYMADFIRLPYICWIV
jgi:dolichol-phosphate mannosyltransferase